ncbi:MAG: hypothetical protein NT105_19500 [Verrucomicrobia bacterium]|nr:hypothetical protein [Verrucomicrobiota bacterium]
MNTRTFIRDFGNGYRAEVTIKAASIAIGSLESVVVYWSPHKPGLELIHQCNLWLLGVFRRIAEETRAGGNVGARGRLL